MILYANPVSNFAAKVRIALELKGLAYEERLPPGGYGTPTYKAIVPLGTIPAIVDGDFVLSESETIVEYLEDAYPQPALLPQAPKARARVRLLSRFHDLYLEPALRAMFAQITPSTRQHDALPTQLARFTRRLTELDHLADPTGPYLAGDLSLADCAYPATLELARAMLPALGAAYTPGPMVTRWEATVSAHPLLSRHRAAYAAEAQAWTERKRAG